MGDSNETGDTKPEVANKNLDTQDTFRQTPEAEWLEPDVVLGGSKQGMSYKERERLLQTRSYASSPSQSLSEC